MSKRVSASFLAPLALVFLLTSSPLQAQPDLAIEGGLIGFTSTGVLVGTSQTTVQLPFTPSLHGHQASLDTQALLDHRAATIYLPTDPPTSERDLSVHYDLIQAVTPPTIGSIASPVENRFIQKMQSLEYRFRKLRVLASKVNRIVNPRITTKNFDIQFHLDGLLHH